VALVAAWARGAAKGGAHSLSDRLVAVLIAERIYTRTSLATLTVAGLARDVGLSKRAVQYALGRLCREHGDEDDRRSVPFTRWTGGSIEGDRYSASRFGINLDVLKVYDIPVQGVQPVAPLERARGAMADAEGCKPAQQGLQPVAHRTTTVERQPLSDNQKERLASLGALKPSNTTTTTTNGNGAPTATTERSDTWAHEAHERHRAEAAGDPDAFARRMPDLVRLLGSWDESRLHQWLERNRAGMPAAGEQLLRDALADQRRQLEGSGPSAARGGWR
jgi:hypothetical protein